jgi:hypothetical protein
MTRVVLDAQTLSRLKGLTSVVEICNEDGNLIGIAVRSQATIRNSILR